MRFLPCSEDGSINDSVRKRVGQLLPASSGERVSLASAFVLRGVKAPPKPSAMVTTTARKGIARDGEEHAVAGPRRGRDDKKESQPTPHASRALKGKGWVASELNHGQSARKRASPTSSPRGRRNEGHGGSDEPAGRVNGKQTSAIRASKKDRRDGGAKKQAEEQAAKMATRQKRCVCSCIVEQSMVIFIVYLLWTWSWPLFSIFARLLIRSWCRMHRAM